MASRKFKELVGKRIKILSGFYFVLVIIFIFKLGYHQLVNPEIFLDKGATQQQKDEMIIPKRGIITDRNGKVLADSIRTYDLTLEKKIINDSIKKKHFENIEEIASFFEEILGISKDEFIQKYTDNKPRFIVAKRVSQESVDKIKEKIKKGIRYDVSSQRIYPYGQFASHVLGHVSNDNLGLAGIEAYFDKELRGVYGRRIVVKDAENREVPDSEIRISEAIDGYRITLTIDEVIQRYVEKALTQAMVDTNAVSVTSIVMNAKTGEILAMASKPDYDPNNPRIPKNEEMLRDYNKAKTQEEKSLIISKMWRNPSVNDVYEPGSTFKVITAATGIEKNIVKANEWFYDSGYIKVNDRIIKNWTSVPYGKVDFRKATVESINTVFVEVGNRIGGEEFLKYIDAFGFGRKTGIEIPGEADGIIYSKENLRPVELATMSFGQGISVTPIQLISAISVIANDGKLIKPTLVREISNVNGDLIKRNEIEVIRNPISEDTATKTIDIMKSVGEAAKKAQIEGYTIAVKSGTAQKVINGKYGAYIGSFIGIVPAENPELIVLAIVDQPRKGSNYGGAIAAPIVKNIMEYSLRYLGINPDVNEDDTKKVTVPEIRNISFSEAKKILSNKNLKYRFATTSVNVEDNSIIIDSFPKPGEKIKQGSEIILYIRNNEDMVVVPNLYGKTIDEASKILDSLGLKSSFNGVGTVKGQSPKSNSKIKIGSIVSLDLKE